MSSATANLTPEQQELLDSGLRMLAHMIAETHLRRTALRKTSNYTAPSSEMAKHTEHLRKTSERYHDDMSPKDQHE